MEFRLWWYPSSRDFDQRHHWWCKDTMASDAYWQYCIVSTVKYNLHIICSIWTGIFALWNDPITVIRASYWQNKTVAHFTTWIYLLIIGFLALKSFSILKILSKRFLTVAERDDYTPHGTRWQCTAKTFGYGVFNAYSLKLKWVMYFLCPKIRFVV